MHARTARAAITVRRYAAIGFFAIKGRTCGDSYEQSPGRVCQIGSSQPPTLQAWWKPGSASDCRPTVVSLDSTSARENVCLACCCSSPSHFNSGYRVCRHVAALIDVIARLRPRAGGSSTPRWRFLSDLRLQITSYRRRICMTRRRFHALIDTERREMRRWAQPIHGSTSPESHNGHLGSLSGLHLVIINLHVPT